MKKYSLMIALFAINVINYSFGQTAADVLEKSIRIKKNERIFLKLKTADTSFQFVVANHLGLNGKNEFPKFNNLENDQLFASSEKGIEVYLVPYNPLNFGVLSSYSTYSDPIDSAETASLKTIMDLLESISKGTIESSNGFDFNPADIDTTELGKFDRLFKKTYLEILVDKKKDIMSSFGILKGMSFDDKIKTKEKIDSEKDKFEKLKTFFIAADTKLKDLLSEYDKLLQDEKINANSNGLAQVLLRKILVDDLNKVYEGRKTQFLNYESAMKAIQTMYDEGTSLSVAGLDWLLHLKSETLKDGSISKFDFEIKNGLYHKNKSDEIEGSASKSYKKSSIKIRTFNWIVPEASIGTAYIFMKYNEYSVAADSSGQHIVGNPVSKNLNSLNVTAMLNLTLYIPESKVNPFWQVGAAYSSGMPSIFSGFGLRLNSNRMNRLALSFGGALTWRKELNKLSVGDQVESQSVLDDDLKLQLAWPPKPYVGIQYNF